MYGTMLFNAKQILKVLPTKLPNIVCHQFINTKESKDYAVGVGIYKFALNMAKTSDTNSLPVVYRSLESVLNVLNNEKYNEYEPVRTLLSIYSRVCKEHKQGLNRGESKRHPLIIMEGLDGSGKTTVTRRLTADIKGIKWCTPPFDLKTIRPEFDNHAALRTAFYALGNYIAGLQISMLLQRKPVVMDRYWHSTAAYAIAQAVQDEPDRYTMPPQGDNFYCWPDDLLKPDIVFFLDADEEVRQQRHSRRNTTNTSQEQLLKSNTTFRQNVVQAYKNMYNPGVETVNCNGTVEEIIAEISKKIQHLLK